MNFKQLKYITLLTLAFLLQAPGIFAQCAVYGCTDGAVSFGYAWRGKEDPDSYSMADAKRDAKNSCETNGCKSCTFRYSSENYGWYALLYYFNKNVKKLVHAVGYSPFSEMDAKGIAQDVFEKQYLKHFNQKAPKDIYIKDTWFVAAKAGEEPHAAGVHNHIAEDESKDKLFFKGAEAFDKKDYKTAKMYFEMAEKGDGFYPTHNTKAALLLGQMYFFGLGLEKDYQKAFDYFEKAKSIRNVQPSAQYFLAVMYLEGLGVKKDTNKAVGLLKTAAYNGHQYAETLLKNVRRKYWYEEAVKAYQKKDYKTAFDNMLYAVTEYESVDAMIGLGDLYYNGQGVEKNVQAAVEWYEKAAKKGSAQGMYLMGEAYEKGIFVTKDLNKAKTYYENAKKNGFDAEKVNEALKRLENDEWDWGIEWDK